LLEKGLFGCLELDPNLGGSLSKLPSDLLASTFGEKPEVFFYLIGKNIKEELFDILTEVLLFQISPTQITQK